MLDKGQAELDYDSESDWLLSETESDDDEQSDLELEEQQKLQEDLQEELRVLQADDGRISPVHALLRTPYASVECLPLPFFCFFFLVSF